MNAKPKFTEELAPSADDVLVFIDDTGHESFAGNQAFYGLGGCLLFGQSYPYLKDRWRGVRKAINGNADLPLHGSKMTRTQENFDALSKFFLDKSFFRIAVTTTKEVLLPPIIHPCVPVMAKLQSEISIIAAISPCKSLWIILESSQRADAIVQSHFSQLTPIESLRSLPTTYCLMPKSANEPGLEVADFIVGAAGSQIRRRMRGEDGLARDFRDVFGRLPIVGCRYHEVSHVTLGHDGSVGVTAFEFTSA